MFRSCAAARTSAPDSTSSQPAVTAEMLRPPDALMVSALLMAPLERSKRDDLHSTDRAERIALDRPQEPFEGARDVFDHQRVDFVGVAPGQSIDDRLMGFDDRSHLSGVVGRGQAPQPV